MRKVSRLLAFLVPVLGVVALIGVLNRSGADVENAEQVAAPASQPPSQHPRNLPIAAGAATSSAPENTVSAVVTPPLAVVVGTEAVGAGPVAATQTEPAFAHPTVQSVVEATRTGEHPERLTLAVDPAPFDAAVFAQDPQAYVNVTEPARVYQTAPAGPDAVALVATVDHTIRIPANGSTPLTVIGKPNAPISFAVLDGGSLPNGLGSITVLADAEGKATTTYTATPGTVDEVQILVGSPMTVGTLTLVVHVQDPAAISAR